MVPTTSVERPAAMSCAPSVATPTVYITPGEDEQPCHPPELKGPA